MLRMDEERIVFGVLDQFADLCRYPHPSRGEGPLADFVEELLRQRGLTPVRDAWDNIMADVPATPGREDAPLTILQGHLDMVCAVKPDSGYVPATSPVVPIVDRGMLRSDGNSSLGADNNLGNAAVLWLLEQETPHGPLRLLFTTAEEVGLQGAKNVDPGWLAGAKCLINTDGFSLGKAVVSSAGGLRERFSRPIEYAPRTKPCLFLLEITGFPGGHSGYDIHKERPNPIGLTAQWLQAVRKRMDFELVALSGGHAENAIPMDCTALLAVDEKDISALKELGEELTWSVYVPDGTICLTRQENGAETVWTQACRDEVVDALAGFYDGVYSWRDFETDQVSTSANLGLVAQEAGQLHVRCFIRFTTAEDEQALAQQHRETAERGGFCWTYDRYPAWEESGDDFLVSALAHAWWDMKRTMIELSAVHVGLEPAVLGAKNPDMLMVSTGPTIYDPHSLDERAPLECLADYVRLLAGVLDKISNGNI